MTTCSVARSHAITIEIRLTDTDMFGYMNNVSVFTYFEEAIIESMNQIELFDFNVNPDELPIVADLKCDYHAQVYFGESIKLYVKPAKLGNSSIDIHYMAVKKDDTICFTGRGKLVKVNIKTGKPSPLTDGEKSKLKIKPVAN